MKLAEIFMGGGGKGGLATLSPSPFPPHHGHQEIPGCPTSRPNTPSFALSLDTES